MGTLFNLFIYQPLYNTLVFLYNIIPGGDFGIAIIAITILLRALLIPVYKKQIQSQKQLQILQPKIKEIQQKFKNDKEKQTKELMELYKTHKTNPFSGCLPLIIQLVFLIAIYQILITISNSGLTIDPAKLYSFVPNPGKINHLFIGIVDLTKASPIIAFLAAVAQYYQTKMLIDKPRVETAPKKNDEPDFASIMNKQMLYIGPLLTFFIGIKFPAGLSLYWLAGTLFMLVQQILLEKKDASQK